MKALKHLNRLILPAVLLAAAALPALAAAPVSAPAAPVTSSDRVLPLNRYAWSRQAQQGADEFYEQPVGLCEDYPEESTQIDKIRRDFETMKALGVRHLRFAFGWDSIEQAPGQYHWGFWDELVKLAGEYGISLLPYVCYTPAWANDGGDNFWRTPPRDPASFGRFMQVIVKRYKGQIRSWELWNEPDLEAYWLGSPDQFADMIQQAAGRVRAADPGAVIVLGGMSRGRGPFFERLIQTHHLDRYVDVLNLHGYNETWHPAVTEDYPEQIRYFGSILPPGGAEPDIWLAEFGYSNWRFGPTTVSQWGIDAIYAYEHTPRYQAISLFKQHLMALEAGNLSLTAWYRINDLTPGTGVIGDDNNKFLGVLDSKGKPKPAWHALKLYTGLYSRPLRGRSERLQQQLPAKSQAVVTAFETEDGHLLLSAWLRSSRRDEVADKSGMAKDSRSETLALQLPGGYKSLQAYAISGEKVQTKAYLQSGWIRNLSLSGGEIFVAELGN